MKERQFITNFKDLANSLEKESETEVRQQNNKFVIRLKEYLVKYDNNQPHDSSYFLEDLLAKQIEMMPEKRKKEGKNNILLIKDYFDGKKKSNQFCRCGLVFTSPAENILRDNLMENFVLAGI